MIAVLVLFFAAVVAGVLVPHLLGRLDPARWDPLVLLVGWFASMAGVVVTVAAGFALLLTPGHGAANELVLALHQCWIAVIDGEVPRAEQVVGISGAVGLLVLAARFTLIVVRSARRRDRKRHDYLALFQVGTRRQGDTSMTLWLDHDRPLAFSMAGRPGVVVATEGLTRHLSHIEVAAVLEHERAHLRGRHHQLLAWVDALATALPFVPLFRHARSAVRELVELSADVAAVRTCGVGAVRSALLRMSTGAEALPGQALAMAKDGVEIRLARLRRGDRTAGRLRRAMVCTVAATTALTLPIVTGIWMLLLAAVACPLVLT